MKAASYLHRVPAVLRQVEVMLHVPHFVASGNREAGFHLRSAVTFLVKAIRVHRGLPPQQTQMLADLVYGNGTNIEGLPLDDPWREHLERFLAMDLPRTRVQGHAAPIATEDLRGAVARLRGLMPIALREIGGRAAEQTPPRRSIPPPTSMWRA